MQKIQLNVAPAKREVNTLNEGIINKVRKISVEPNHSIDYVATWVNNGLSQLSSELEKMKDDSKKTVTEVSSPTMKIVGNGLSQFNAKAAEVVNKFPGSVGVKAGEYPWVSISFALLAGFLLRSFFKSQRN